MTDLTERWPAVRDAFASLAYEHLPAHLQAVSKPFHDLGVQLLAVLPDHRQLVFALDKLVEAKDCAVRVAVRTHQPGNSS